MLRDLPAGLAARVISLEARQYATATGWKLIQLPNDLATRHEGRITLFERPEDDSVQMIVPMDSKSADYEDRMAEVISHVASWEKRPHAEVLNDLLNAGSDVIRFRVQSPAAEAGALPLEDGIRLLEGARTALLASAHSVLTPSLYHRRMSKSEPEDLLKDCRVGQSERGSYVTTIACPLRAGEGMLFDNEPFGRRATTLLIESASEIVSAIETDQLAAAVERNRQTPRISANLCDALLRMKPSAQDGEITIGVTWSVLRPAPAGFPSRSSVRIQQEYFPAIEDLYRELRPKEEPLESTFAGFVEKLEGEPGVDGRMHGSVTLHLFTETEEAAHARAHLDANQYAIAVQAHGANDVILVKGKLNRSRRTGTLDNPSNFRLMPPDDEESG